MLPNSNFVVRAEFERQNRNRLEREARKSRELYSLSSRENEVVEKPARKTKLGWDWLKLLRPHAAT